MFRFLRDIVIFGLLQSLLIGTLIWRCYDVRAVSPLSPATVIKHKRLQEAASPRLILIGGSNLLFGIDSKMIEQQLPYHPVNMGLIGGLRLDYIVNEIEETLRAGDVVVMSLEYNTLNAAPNSDETQVIMGVAARRLKNLRFVTAAQWKRLLDQGAVEYLGIVFRQSFSNIIPKEDDDDPLISQDMNAYGDLTRYHDPAVRPRRQNNQNTIVKIKPENVEANLARMNAFVDRCRARDVQVFFSWPPLPRTHYEQERDLARRFHRQLRQGLRATVLGPPGDMVFADRDFIGLSYHLRGGAVQERTQRLIDSIARRVRRAASRPANAASP